MFLNHSDYIGVPLFRIVLAGLLTVLLIGLEGCGRSTPVRQTMDRAESIMESAPDSAYGMLRGIDSAHLVTDGDRGRYALLMSMAMDKNCIDVTDIEVILPAVEYYADHGTPDEKMRVHYYLGRIYQNKGDNIHALMSFIDADSVDGDKYDSLTMARLWVAEGRIYEQQFRIEEFTRKNLAAAAVFERCSVPESMKRCYMRALDGALGLSQDSLVAILRERLYPMLNTREKTTAHYKLTYFIDNDMDGELEELLGIMCDTVSKTSILNLDMATAALKLNHRELAVELADRPIDIHAADTFKYHYMRGEIFETLGLSGVAVEEYRQAMNNIVGKFETLTNDKALFADDFRDLYLARALEQQKRQNQTWIFAVIGLLAVVIICIIYIGYKNNRHKRELAEARNFDLIVHQKQLESENRGLSDVKQELECNLKQQMETVEMMHARIEILEEMKNTLENSMNESHNVDSNLQKRRQQRIGMLNGLLLRELSANNKYAKSYYERVQEIVKDKDAFKKAVTDSFRDFYPGFMKWLEDYGLTQEEIDLVCLFAINMQGKEIITTLEIRNLYNISSVIRAKLGLRMNDMNLGSYIRKKMAEFD